MYIAVDLSSRNNFLSIDLNERDEKYAKLLYILNI
jgi:hypothetical protein